MDTNTKLSLSNVVESWQQHSSKLVRNKHIKCSLVRIKVGFYLKAVFPSRDLGLMWISRSRFKQSKNYSFISQIYVLWSFVNFWVIFGDIWVFLNGLVKFREIRNGVDLMWWGELPEKFGRGVRPAFHIPYPIYDQNLRLSLPYLWPDQKFGTLWLLDH